MIYVVSGFLVIAGLFFTYVTAGLVRSKERKRGYEECEDRIRVLRLQLRRRQ